MRAALLPTPGEPFMLAYWLRNFETWRDEVDELLVYVNGRHAEACDMVTAAGGRVLHETEAIGHGPAIAGLLAGTEADVVVLCEDDAYARRQGAVREAFERLESDQADIIGSPRYEDYANVPIEETWPTPTGELADLGRALWPTFLFARRDDLLATNRRFGDTVHRRGEMIPGLGVPVTREMCDYINTSPYYIHVDTFYATTWQLRHKRIELVHRVRVIDPEAAETWVANDPPWFHITGLSAIHIVLDGTVSDLPDWGPDGGLWPRRVAWWERTYRTAPQELRESDYGRRYRERLDRFRSLTGLSAAAIDAWDARLAPWVTWE